MHYLQYNTPTYSTNTNTYTTYNIYNIIRLLNRLTILAQRNQTYLQYIKRKKIKGQLTSVSNFNSEIRTEEDIHGIYPPCFFSFIINIHFQGTKIKFSRDYNRANRGPHFFKAIVVILLSIS